MRKPKPTCMYCGRKLPKKIVSSYVPGYPDRWMRCNRDLCKKAESREDLISEAYGILNEVESSVILGDDLAKRIAVWKETLLPDVHGSERGKL